MLKLKRIPYLIVVDCKIPFESVFTVLALFLVVIIFSDMNIC